MTDLEKYIIARWAYSVGKPLITDAEYNILHQLICEKYPNSEYTKRSWSSDPCPAQLLRREGLESLIREILITDKTESIESLNSFIDIQNTYRNLNETGTISMKHDGWNFQFSYYQGELYHIQSRGRSCDPIVADCLRELVPKCIPEKTNLTIVGEVTIPNSNFPEVQRIFGNKSQRGSVSTIIANPQYVHLAAFHAFDIKGTKKFDMFPTLKSWGFNTPDYIVINNYQDLLNAIETLSERKVHYDFPTDGLVVATSHAKALRVRAWEEPIYKSYITGYTEDYGPMMISVGLTIRPIKLSNSTQKVLPATNLARVIENDLRIGSPVAFKFISGSIASIDLEATRMLQKQYQGRFDSYRHKIDGEENLKCQY